MSSPTRRSTVYCLFLILLPGIMTTGCAGKPASSVSGSVKFKGQLLPAGTITFLCQSGEKRVVSSEIKDGKYSVENLTPGSTNVTVLTIPPTKAGAMPSGKSAVAAHESATPPGKYVPIPKRYALPDQSGLTFEVQPGSQTKDFDLTP